jgi:hypothetical protein
MTKNQTPLGTLNPHQKANVAAAAERKMKDLLIVDTPTRLDVVVALCHVLGAMYPGAVMRSDTGHVIHVQVDDDDLAREIDWETLVSEYPLDDDLIGTVET